MNDDHVGSEFGLPPAGHNLPPDPLEALRADLVEVHGDLMSRADALLAGIARAPATITDEDTAARIADFAKQVAACIKLAEERRTRAKQPHLDAGRAIDAWFKRLTDALDGGRRALLDRLTAYQRAKAEAARAKAEAEERARREAERIERERVEAELRAAMEAERAAKSEGEKAAALQRAIDAEARAAERKAEAEKAAAIAAAKPAELSRTRGDYGAVASIRARWTYEVVDLAKVPREYLALNPTKVNAAIKAGLRECPGLRIFQEQTTVVR